MKLILLLATLGLVTILADNNTKLLKTFSDRYHNLTFNTYKRDIEIGHPNFVVCPTALNLIFAILYAGAKGSSAENIANLLQIPESSEVIHQTFSDLARKLNRDANLYFSNRNKIYIQDGFQTSNTYNKTIVDIFKGNIHNIDFKRPTKAAETVNTWVYEKSNQLISKTISIDNLHDSSTMLLVSTMDFRGLFTNTLFKEEATIERDFYIRGNRAVKTDMMEAFSNCSYYESKELDARFLKLNFTNIPNGSITFVSPNDEAGLNDLRFNLDQVLVKPNYSNEYVHIYIPRFKINVEPWPYQIHVSWKDYTDTANFTVIGANQEPLKINYIRQRVSVEVNENGAGATWATSSVLDSIIPSPNNGGKMIGPTGGSGSLDFDDEMIKYVQPGPRTFQANHPFMYYITLDDTIIVVGLFSKPEVGDANLMRNFPAEIFKKAENETNLGSRSTSAGKSMTSIVEEYTCPCILN